MSYDEGVPPPGLDPELAEELQRRGIPTLDVDSVLVGIANRIVNNEQLCAFLLTIETTRRKDAYDALHDRLRFPVEPFSIVMHRQKKVLKKMKARLRFVPTNAKG